MDLCREYLTEAHRTVAQLRAAFATQQAGELRDRAHYLKGSSLVVGAQGVTRCCANLEATGKIGDLNGAGEMIEQLSAALGAAEQELVRRLGPDVVPIKGSVA